MFVLYMSSVMIIIATGFINVRTSSFDRKMDIFNEVKLIFVMYHMMLFTDFLPDPETQSQIGYSVAVIVVLGTLVNMTMLFITPIKRLKIFFKIRTALKHAKKE